MKTSVVPLLALLPCLLSGAALAEQDFVLREHRFDLSEIRELRLDGSVGEIEIEPVQGNELSVILEVRGKDEGWFKDRKDVSQVDLESRQDGERLVLRMTEEDTETHWRLALPAVAAVNIDFGVGAVRVALSDSDLNVDLGVGELTIRAPSTSVGEVDLDVGVGEARIHGVSTQDAKRAFVSHTVNAHGEGQHSIRADVGVGEIRVALE